MIDPEHSSRTESEEVEHSCPGKAERVVTVFIRGNPVPVESDVTRFIADDEFCHGDNRRVARVLAEQLVVVVARDFGQEQGVEFERHSKGSADTAKDGEAPVFGDGGSSHSLNRFSEEFRMSLFFDEPEVDEGSHLRMPRKVALSVMPDEVSGSSSVPELKLSQGAKKRTMLRFGERVARCLPVRFRAIRAVSGEVIDPGLKFHDPNFTSLCEEGVKGQ